MPQRLPDDRLQDLLKDLNPAQRKAVTHGEGPLLIIAGAGTGKTKVITNRIAYLIASKMASPEEILAVTFTEKAANEMEARVDLLVPYTYSFVEISTFNSFGEKVLRDYGMELGYPPDFRLLDDVEQAIFFRKNLFKFSLRYFRPLGFPTKHIQELLDTIKKLKQEDVPPGDYLDYAQALKAKASDDVMREEALKQVEMARVYGEYRDLLKEKWKIDFEDQVTLAAELFRTRPFVLKEFQSRYKYILVDEFPDTNFVQFELLKLLVARHGNLTVVGDDDQSIFRFRGASLSNILNFKKVYPRAEKIVLTRNYRSTQAILDASHQLIRHNDPNRLEFKLKINKQLVSSLDIREKSIHMLQSDSVSHEADRVADLVLEKYGNIRLFFDKVKGFSDLTDDDSIHSFAGYLLLVDNPATSEAELDEDAVNVLTVHKAKGLEFSVVFLVSLIEDRYPGRERRRRFPYRPGSSRRNCRETRTSSRRKGDCSMSG